MGVSIHYSGALDHPNDWQMVTQRLKLVADQLAWPWWEVDIPVSGLAQGVYIINHPEHGEMVEVQTHEVNDHIRGLSMQPPDTETFHITFNQAGRLAYYYEFPDREPPYHHIDTLWVKTNRAVQSHIYLCDILRYLQERYMPQLKVYDEADFFVTQDITDLIGTHRSFDKDKPSPSPTAFRRLTDLPNMWQILD